jgi:hypothetical protein
LLLLGTSRAAMALEWTLPSVMEWHTSNGTCEYTGQYHPFLKGCHFGKPESVEHSGLAFFRICGNLREARPFLTVDFVRNTYSFDLYVDGYRLEEGPLELDESSFPPYYSIDPVPFFLRVNDGRGSCWTSGTPA